jgi:hypothetical protein
MAFPTLSRRPISDSVSYEDNSISHSLEAGYSFRRPRFTRSRRIFEVRYDAMPNVDKLALEAHFDAVGTHTSFTWTDLAGNSHNVYYTKPLSFEFFITGWYKVETIQLMEV